MIQELTYQKVKEQSTSRGYKWFDGKMDPNLVFFRTSQEYTNSMTDIATLSYLDTDGLEVFIQIPCSTKPALYGKGSVNNPNVIHGISGVGVIAEGQHLGAWLMANFDQLKEGVTAFDGNPHLCPSLHQRGKFKVYRDGNLDLFISKEILMDSIGDGFNFHYAQKDLSFKDSPYLPWSTGCPTATPKNIFEFFSLMEETIPYSGKIISPTIIETNG